MTGAGPAASRGIDLVSGRQPSDLSRPRAGGPSLSSLAYLRDLPIDILKIDRSFLPIDPDPGLEAMVRTIVDLGHSLGLTCVAEGVETADQADMLSRLGCDKGQGWLFGRPTPADRTTEILGAGVRTTAPVTTALSG